MTNTAQNHYQKRIYATVDKPKSYRYGVEVLRRNKGKAICIILLSGEAIIVDELYLIPRGSACGISALEQQIRLYEQRLSLSEDLVTS